MREELKKRKPSEEKVWLKHYKEGTFEKVNDIPNNMTVWDILEEKLHKYSEYPAIEYFKREISRPDFTDDVYMWARTFRAMGVEEEEVVPIYGPFFPDICAMTCALNMIGATAYFLKLAITKEALEEETIDAKVAVVFDGMWGNVKDVFSDARFKRILVATPSDAMLSPKKEVVSTMNYFQQLKNNSLIPRTSKYVWLDDAKRIANYYTGKVKVPFVENRSAYITSSSGTTGNVVKGIVATNESVISQLLQGYYADVPFYPGDKCLTDFPPTASTALNCLFLLPLYRGMTLINDPRVSEDAVYKMVMHYRPQVTIKTGSFWEAFFRDLDKDIKRGKRPDLSFFKMPILGGEGATREDFRYWNDLMFKYGSSVPLFSGGGMSEVFAVCSIENMAMPSSFYDDTYPINSVGIPYPGLTVGVFDKNGNELGYHERGELWIKGKSIMKGYYNKPALTEKVIGKDGWLRTGDMYHIEEDGRLRVWGRLFDCANFSDKETFLFDLVNKIREDEAIKYSIVNAHLLDDDSIALLAHVVFKEDFQGSKRDVYRRLDKELLKILPKGIEISGYKDHEITFAASKTTAKKDREILMNDLDGYIKPVENGFNSLTLLKDEETQKYSLDYKELEKSKVLTLRSNKQLS